MKMKVDIKVNHIFSIFADNNRNYYFMGNHSILSKNDLKIIFLVEKKLELEEYKSIVSKVIEII